MYNVRMADSRADPPDDQRPVQDLMANLVYASDQCIRAINERHDAGEDIPVRELLDAFTKQAQTLRDGLVMLGLEIDRLRHGDAS